MEAAPPSPPPQPARYRAFLKRTVTFFVGPFTWRNVRTWAAVIAVVLLCRWMWFDQFKIPTGSMEPSLHGDLRFFRGDRVSINKFIYGHRFPLNQFRIPFTDMVLDYADRRLWRGAEPQRWDIVVFKSVEEDSRGKTLVKRVVGLPGERVHIAKGKVRVNGEPIEPPPELRPILTYTNGPTNRNARRLMLELTRLDGPPALLNPRHAGARKFIEVVARLRDLVADKDIQVITDDEAEELLRDVDPIALQIARELCALQYAKQGTFRYGIRSEDAYAVVPKDCYFLLGDNSDNSRDGRAFGWVPNEHILGRVFCIWSPFSRWRDFTGFSRTWWGMAILYGIPALIVVHELRRYLRKRRSAAPPGHETKPAEPTTRE